MNDFRYEKASINADWAASLTEAEFIKQAVHLWHTDTHDERMFKLKKAYAMARQITGKPIPHGNSSGNATATTGGGYTSGSGGSHRADEGGSDKSESGATIPEGGEV